ncbi:2-phospho-L-lactate guanylyltransferase [Kineococcus sp. NPDC059986]|uniref:2-phospho-L-lactate guanylyltransferase n=1 Tax=Kineococcus sp. NPDC059986 TaxID=3155538 RepID=UPI00344F8EEE
MTHVSGWRVVVPVKGGDEAKTRLALPRRQRQDLALAMALDCLAACRDTPGVGLVVCVSDDPEVLAAVRAVGVGTVSPGRPGLAVAVAAGLASVERGPTAVLLGDLPALRTADLADALAQAGQLPGPALVADAAGSGSVLLADAAGNVPHHFGPDSARRHVAAGAVALSAPLPSLRRDVDTVDDLRSALTLGVGPRTRAALAHDLPDISIPAHDTKAVPAHDLPADCAGHRC